MLAHSRNPQKHDVPGVKGIKFGSGEMHLYFTTTTQTIFGRIQIDPETLVPNRGSQGCGKAPDVGR
jgi:hypothetical protein